MIRLRLTLMVFLLPRRKMFSIPAFRRILGLENAKMFRPGYAIEYDYFPPTHCSLRWKPNCRVKGLYFAGQINGTTGYEEAGCQGLTQVWNAALAVKEEMMILKRSEAYIGVLIDDLINEGTSRAVLHVHQPGWIPHPASSDNADLRLTPIAHKLGVAGSDLRAWIGCGQKPGS